MSALIEVKNGVIRRVTNTRWRRTAYAVLLLVFAIFSIWPRPYVARARLIPQDTASAAGTTALMTLIAGQSQNIQSLLGGGKASNDLYLIIGRSDSVARRVIDKLKLVGPNGYANADEAKRKLARKVDVSLLLGGVMEIEAKSWDAAESKRLTSAYVDAVSKELAQFGDQVNRNKQRIISERFGKAVERVGRAEDALNKFRRNNNLAAPEQQLGAELALRASLQAQLQASQVELQQIEQFSGPENSKLQAVRTQIASLRDQIARSAAPATNAAGPNLAGSGDLTTRYLTLYQEYRLSQAIYEVYARSQEQVAIDELAAESASYVQIVDNAYIDPERHYNVWSVAALAAVLLLMIFTDIYGPYTGLFDLARPDARREDEP